LAKHPFYKRYSLGHIFQSLSAKLDARSKQHDGVYALKQLFEILDEGAEDIDIPFGFFIDKGGGIVLYSIDATIPSEMISGKALTN
jgi:hypothetical protein